MKELALYVNGEEILTARVFDDDQQKARTVQNMVDVFVAHVLSDAEDEDDAVKWLHSLKWTYTEREILDPGDHIEVDPGIDTILTGWRKAKHE